MTKLREVNSVEGAIQRAIGLLTAEIVAKAVGKSVRLVRAWSDEDDDLHKPSIFQAMAVDSAMVAEGYEPEILRVYTRQVEAQRNRHNPKPLGDRMLDLIKEIGDVAEVARAATDPAGPSGVRISLKERCAIAKEIAEAQAVLNALERDFEVEVAA